MEHSHASHEGCHKAGAFPQGHHAHMVSDFKRRFWGASLLTLPILLLSPKIQEFLGLEGVLAFPGQEWALLFLASLVYFYGGWPFLTGLASELKQKNPGMMTLIGVAISTAYLYSAALVLGLEGMPFFWELATLIDIMLLGHWIEMNAILGAGKALASLAHLMPATARRLAKEGTRQENVPLESLSVGDHVLVKPGESVPCDGIVLEGESAVSEALLTGESALVLKSKGSAVLGGSLNGEGALTLRVGKTLQESFVYGVIKLVEEAQASKSKVQDLANRTAFWLTLVALGAGVLTALAWFFLTTKGVAFALERMVTVMVITCPHALGLAVPLVVAVSTSLGASRGLLIRNRSAFERARRLQAVIFDKTGTLTQGCFTLTDILAFGQISQEEVLMYAASTEQHSQHPLAGALVKASKTLHPVTQFLSLPGRGVQGLVQGRLVKVVSVGAFADFAYEGALALTQEGKTVVYVLLDDVPIGALALSDEVRADARDAVAHLIKQGITCMMLTGDTRQAGERIAREVGITHVMAQVLPHEKAARVKEIQKQYVCAMVGDGVNDAPALAQADVGIAIGSGTDVALNTADIILIKNNLMDVVALVGLARNTYAKMVQNLVWATGYNVIAIPAAAGVFYAAGLMMSPAIGAVLMTLSTIVCAVNAKLLSYKRT